MSRSLLILTHNVVSLRAAPSSDAEQVSQGIMGDVAEAQSESEDYVRLLTRDGYEGWALTRHTAPFDPSAPAIPNTLSPLPGQQAVSVPIADARDAGTKLVFGTPVLLIGAGAHTVRVRLANGFETDLSEDTVAPESRGAPPDPERLVSLARMFLGTPYLWGGGSSFGFDCSGFVQRIYAFAGLVLPRDAYLQAENPLGVRLEISDGLCAGDLVFFAGDSDPLQRRITHVGLATGAHSFIHASGKDGVIETALSDPYYARIRCGALRIRV
jgi:cell wall-associated NlpC family hydrolase